MGILLVLVTGKILPKKRVNVAVNLQKKKLIFFHFNFELRNATMSADYRKEALPLNAHCVTVGQ